MRRYDIPVAPTSVVMILGPVAEQQLRRALAISQGDMSVFVTHPISASILALTAALVIVPIIWKRRQAKRAETVPEPATS